MALYRDFPTLINNVAIPSPRSWALNPNEIESVMQTEAGTDIVDTTRLPKMEISASYRLAEGTDSQSAAGVWVSQFQNWYMTPQLTVQVYDLATRAYKTMTMRMRNFRATLVKKSDMLTTVNGVWDVSFTLIEY